MNNFLSIAVIFLPIPVFVQLCGSVSAGDRPNIVIFLADDLGYADIGVHGCKDIPTPNIDTIAKNSGTPNQ